MRCRGRRIPGHSFFRALSLQRIAAGALCVCLPACASDPRQGYAVNSGFPASVATVRVPVFENYTFDVGLEAELTEAVIKEIQRIGGVRVVQSDDAESTLSATITGSDLHRLTLARGTGLVQEMALTITLDFQWRDNRTGEVIVQRRNFASSETFVPARPGAERVETGRHAVVQRMAHDLVAEMRAAW
jgi:hypothetical protein